MHKQLKLPYVTVEDNGMTGIEQVFYNLNDIELMEHAINRSEGHLGIIPPPRNRRRQR